MNPTLLEHYNPDMSETEFRQRYTNVLDYHNRPYISKEKMWEIWSAFGDEKQAFLESHKNLKEEDIIRIGIDKFVFTMGWHEPEDVTRWSHNKVRVGYCCHCRDQFILMMMQHNYGLCPHCKPLFSSDAIREFLKKQMYSDRYHNAHRDLYMDFFIMFYNDEVFRSLFRKGTDFANDLERQNQTLPDWLARSSPQAMQELVRGEDGVYEIEGLQKKRQQNKTARTSRKTRRL